VTTMNLRPSQNIAAVFRKKIEKGQWAIGDRLPTTKELSKEYQVSVNTIQGAFRYLEAEDLVERHPRRGGFVKAPKVMCESREGREREIAIIAESVSREEPREGHNWCYWIARAAERELSGAGYHISLLSWIAEDSSSQERILQRLEEIKDRLAGVICFPMPGLQACLDMVRGHGIRAVTINRVSGETVEDFVSANNIRGGRLVGECFGRMKYEQVVFLGDVASPGSTTLEKYCGFLQGYMECGMSPQNVQYVACDGFHDTDGYSALARCVERTGRPRGVFAQGDFLALGAMRLCNERGWSIPDQVGVVGASGLDVARYSTPSLTVLAQPMDRMGTEAAAMLMEMIQQNKMHLPGRFIESEFVQRQSFAIPAGTLKEFNATSGMEAKSFAETRV
jgi:DNA-binding LacI/PurR family transcriptional regulator